MTGQDSERGTFNHRHLILHDHKTGDIHSPMHTLSTAKASFALHNSRYLKLQLLVLSTGTTFKHQRHLYFGKHNMEISQTPHKSSLTSFCQRVERNGDNVQVWCCCYLMVMKALDLSTQVRVSNVSYHSQRRTTGTLRTCQVQRNTSTSLEDKRRAWRWMKFDRLCSWHRRAY